jgi:hypothetical protein
MVNVEEYDYHGIFRKIVVFRTGSYPVKWWLDQLVRNNIDEIE